MRRLTTIQDNNSRLQCACCDGTGMVEAHTGKQRPCSRCKFDDFEVWLRAYRAAEENNSNRKMDTVNT